MLEKSIYYILDAQGNVMSVYERKIEEEESVSYNQTEKYIYGSSRLGVHTEVVPVLASLYTAYKMVDVTHEIGYRNYELTNHLGNVLSVVSDKVISHDNSGTIDYWLADIRQSTDYSPFGVILYNRDYRLTDPSTSNLVARGRYGFNGMEMDNELKLDGNSYDFGARIYDSRLGRWLTIDPLAGKYPNLSTYNFVANSPLQFIDADGKEIIIYDKNQKKVATITRHGTIVEKGMENSSILKSYNETKEYFKGKDDGLFARIESDDRTMTLFEADDLFKEDPQFAPTEKVTMNGKPGDLKYIDPIEYQKESTTIQIGCDFGAIIWNSKIGAIDAEGNSHSPAMVFFHELIHADEYLFNPKEALKNTATYVPVYDTQAEVIAIDKSNEMSKKLANGDGGNGVDLKRTSHGLKEIIETSGPTSNKKIP